MTWKWWCKQPATVMEEVADTFYRSILPSAKGGSWSRSIVTWVIILLILGSLIGLVYYWWPHLALCCTSEKSQRASADAMEKAEEGRAGPGRRKGRRNPRP